MISTTSRKNTYKLVRMDIERVTWRIQNIIMQITTFTEIN